MFTIRGRSGRNPLPLLPLNVTLVLDPPRALTGQCVAMSWPASVAGGRCAFNRTADMVICR